VTTAMAREIAEQPEVVAATLEGLAPMRADVAALLRDRRHLLFVGRGTSDNAGVYGRYLAEVHAGLGAGLAAPSLITHYGVERDLSDTVVVSLSQSGRTDEIVTVQAALAAQGARTIAITSDGTSPLAASADVALVTRAGAELAVPATKTYTAQLVAVALLVDALAPAGRTLVDALARTPDVIADVLDRREGVDDAVAALLATDDALVTGRGLVHGTALEVALKLEETCLRPVRALSYADLRHGPMAVVDRDLAAVLVAASEGPMLAPMRDLATELEGLGAAVVVLGGDAALAAGARAHLVVPPLPEAIAPIVLTIPAQLTVEALARARGLDPDAPRGLSKVTQTDPT
jgi:glucosamine--fructose-6-phosphate aminotransferase (isomerizing)